MIPHSRMALFGAMALALSVAYADAPVRPPSDEEEQKRQQRHLDRLASQQREMDAANRRYNRRTSNSLLDKARRAKVRA